MSRCKFCNRSVTEFCHDCREPAKRYCWLCDTPVVLDAERNCSECGSPWRDPEDGPTERQIEQMVDTPDEAERRAEMARVYFDLK